MIFVGGGGENAQQRLVFRVEQDVWWCTAWRWS
jgi:hypothetical protein